MGSRAGVGLWVQSLGLDFVCRFGFRFGLGLGLGLGLCLGCMVESVAIGALVICLRNLRFRAQSSGFRVQSIGCIVQGS